MRIPEPDYLSYDDLREHADNFLRNYWNNQSIPVDVDKIADAILGLDIIPVSNLLNKTNVDGLYSYRSNAIWVDQYVYDNVDNRYRFTIAHEVGHWYLHQHIHEVACFESIADWKLFYSSMSDKDRFFYEFQAYSFGGLILVQEEPLEEEVRSQFDILPGQQVSQFDDGYEFDFALEEISRVFEVSTDVILKRGQYDGFWEKLQND